MSGVSYGSVKRFEATGKISLLSLTKLAMALDMEERLHLSTVRNGWKQDFLLVLFLCR